jgi:hypothetical protein
MWQSPSKTLEGGGSGQGYCQYGSCSDGSQEWTFVESDIGFWVWYRDYEISEFHEPGEYSWEMSVRNAAELTSRNLKASLEVRNSGYKGEKPNIVDIRLSTTDTSSGTGATSTVTIIAQSSSPVDWLNRSFEGPTSNMYGGGSGFSFENCAEFLDITDHICQGRDSKHYFTSFTDTISRWAPNGTYAYHDISVMNQAQLTSEAYEGDLSFTIENNTVATTPTITSIEMVWHNFGEDPVTSGHPLNGQCITVASVPDTFLSLS